MSTSEREVWRRQLAAIVLADTVASEAYFWSIVHTVSTADSAARQVKTAWEAARAYGTGGRRRSMTRVVLAAAGAPDRRAAKLALFNVGLSASWVGPETSPRRTWSEMTPWGEITYSEAVDASPPADCRSGAYRLGAAYVLPLVLGARYATRAGAGRCWVAEGPESAWCGNAATSGSRYCRGHDVAESLHAKNARERTARRLFDAIASAIKQGPPLPDELEDELALLSPERLPARALP